jgi:hypothetical protein
VSAGPNLALPPDMDLRPPTPGAKPTPAVDGAAIVFGTGEGLGGLPPAPTTLTNLSAGEYALLQQARAITTNASIRQILGEPAPSGAAPVVPVTTPQAAPELVPSAAVDTAADNVIDNFFDDLMFWEGASGMIEDNAVIDPKREAERLKQDAAQGKPAIGGATPILPDGDPAAVETGP